MLCSFHKKRRRRTMSNTDTERRLFVSHLTLRRVVGALGVLLPIVLALWGFVLLGRLEIQPSISDYYGLRTRDGFVGILFVVAWFLFAYKGYERRDDIAGDLACLFALGVAALPNSGSRWEMALHFISATALFLVLSYFSLVLFTKSGGPTTPRKRTRNRIYKSCGVIMLACIALIAIYYWWLDGTSIAKLKPVFWLESFALWAFGCSWFVKGEMLLRDGP